VVEPSYKPGIKMTDLAECLPPFVLEAMREALPVFGRQIAGYDHPDVLMTGVETRTSSPIRITRGKDLQSLNVAGLFPAGEGAGYAGGILSAAVDGIKIAEAVAAAYVDAMPHNWDETWRWLAALEVGSIAYPFWPCLRRQTGWVRVDVAITPDGAYRGHEIVDASPPAVFDRAVARALTLTTYETTDASPLPDRFETLYRFEPPPPPRPRRRATVASQTQA
jgi:hypothetical protein